MELSLSQNHQAADGRAGHPGQDLDASTAAGRCHGTKARAADAGVAGEAGSARPIHGGGYLCAIQRTWAKTKLWGPVLRAPDGGMGIPSAERRFATSDGLPF